MKPHVRIYLQEHGLTEADTIYCEQCGAIACEVHHIESRGMGGRKSMDKPSNLTALCRKCHSQAHGIRVVS